MATKRINPNRIHRTEADVRKAFVQGQRIGIRAATAVILNVLLDKYNAKDWINDIWADVMKLSEEIGDKLVSVDDICKMLKEEYGIKVFSSEENSDG